ncbi:MAG: hypothetical protein SF002_06510 [Alphaproteobacteria bacterium]|nr:hypothetical protein [Alphaproteobacteria bacterium]
MIVSILGKGRQRLYSDVSGGSAPSIPLAAFASARQGSPDLTGGEHAMRVVPAATIQMAPIQKSDRRAAVIKRPMAADVPSRVNHVGNRDVLGRSVRGGRDD